MVDQPEAIMDMIDSMLNDTEFMEQVRLGMRKSAQANKASVPAHSHDPSGNSYSYWSYQEYRHLRQLKARLVEFWMRGGYESVGKPETNEGTSPSELSKHPNIGGYYEHSCSSSEED
jgi:hypothetical protein